MSAPSKHIPTTPSTGMAKSDGLFLLNWTSYSNGSINRRVHSSPISSRHLTHKDGAAFLQGLNTIASAQSTPRSLPRSVSPPQKSKTILPRLHHFSPHIRSNGFARLRGTFEELEKICERFKSLTIQLWNGDDHTVVGSKDSSDIGAEQGVFSLLESPNSQSYLATFANVNPLNSLARLAHNARSTTFHNILPPKAYVSLEEIAFRRNELLDLPDKAMLSNPLSDYQQLRRNEDRELGLFQRIPSVFHPVEYKKETMWATIDSELLLSLDGGKDLEGGIDRLRWNITN